MRQLPSLHSSSLKEGSIKNRIGLTSCSTCRSIDNMMMTRKIFMMIMMLILFITFNEVNGQTNDHRWDNLENIINSGIAEKAFPGAVLLVANKDGPIYSKAFGKFTYNDDEQRVMNTNTTKFDMASVTKVISTTSAVALLYQKDLISLHDSVVKYFPEFGVNGKSGITIENLLLHNSGLAPDPNPTYNTVEFNCSATEIYHPPQVFTCSNKIFNSWLNEKLAHNIGMLNIICWLTEK